jgi:hypothetical protein
MAGIMENVTCPMKDQNWIMKLLFSYVALIPFGGFLLGGYQLRAIREYAREPKDSMPEWDNWVQLLIDGFLVTCLTFVYMLVPMALMFIAYLPMLLTVIGGAGMSSEDSSLQALGGITALLGPILTIVLMIVAVLVSFVSAFLLPMAMGIFAVTGNFFAAINPFGVLGKILSNFGSYIMVVLIPMILGLLINSVLAVTMIGTLLMFPAVLYISIVSAKMLGDMFRENNICY